MSDTPPATPPDLSEPGTNASPVVVKKYANRRLYNTETSSYITLDSLAGMIRAGRDFVVYDAKSGEDITRGVLTQIIVEEESKGSALLPTAFLRQLIAFYGGNLQGVVPQYLDYAMTSFSRQQKQMRQMVERTFGPFLPTGVEEMGRQNMALFDRAMSLWNPFLRESEAKPTASDDQNMPAEPVQDVALTSEVERLRGEIENLHRQLAAARAAALPATTDPAPAIPENVRSDSEPSQATPPAKAQRRTVRTNAPTEPNGVG